jgi:hypothetical protein
MMKRKKKKRKMGGVTPKSPFMWRNPEAEVGV